MLHTDNLITVAASVTPGWHQAPDTSALVRPHLSRITVLWGRGVRVLVKSPGRKLVFGQVELCGNFKTIWLRVAPPPLPHLHTIYNKVCIWAWRSEDNFLLLILVYHLVLSQGCSCFSHVVSFSYLACMLLHNSVSVLSHHIYDGGEGTDAYHHLELKLPGLGANTFTHWATSPVPPWSRLSDWPGTHYLPASASCALGLQEHPLQ